MKPGLFKRPSSRLSASSRHSFIFFLGFTQTGLTAGRLYCAALDSAGVEDSLIIHFHSESEPLTLI